MIGKWGIAEKTAAYCLIKGTYYIQRACPFAFGPGSLKLKDVFNELERRSREIKTVFVWRFQQG